MIEKFFDGKTTIEEEHNLQQYLCTHAVPADLQRDKELILSLMNTPVDAQPREEFVGYMKEMIECISADDEYHATVSVVGKKRRVLGRFMWFRYILYAAAAVAVAFIMKWQFTPASAPDENLTSEEIAAQIKMSFGHAAFILHSGVKCSEETFAQLNDIGCATMSVNNLF